MSQAQLDQLKAKYQSVLNLMSQLGVQLQNLHVQDNKLVIRGQAQTKSVSNKIWDQIKLVNRDFGQDLMAEITYATDDLAAAAAVAGGTQTRSYTVKAGDTLSKIAKAHYGDAINIPRSSKPIATSSRTQTRFPPARCWSFHSS